MLIYNFTNSSSMSIFRKLKQNLKILHNMYYKTLLKFLALVVLI